MEMKGAVPNLFILGAKSAVMDLIGELIEEQGGCVHYALQEDGSRVTPETAFDCVDTTAAVCSILARGTVHFVGCAPREDHFVVGGDYREQRVVAEPTVALQLL